MPINKAKLLLLTFPTILGAAAGAAFQYYAGRANPTVRLLQVVVPSFEQRDSLESKEIDVPKKLVALTEASPTLPTLNPRVDLSKLADLVKELGRVAASSSDTSARIDEWIPKLKAQMTLDDKKKFMLMLAGDNILDGIFTGGLARSEPKYRAPAAGELAALPVLFPYTTGDTGFEFYLESVNYHFEYKNSSFEHLLKPAAEALAKFHQPYLIRVLEAVKVDLQATIQEIANFTSEAEKLLHHSEGLSVRALVLNTGGTPVSLTPWGSLRLFASGNRPDFVIPLRSRKDSHISIKPGESEELLFQSMDTIEQIEEKYQGLEGILKSETVICKLALKRADVTGPASWFPSPTRVLTANEDIKPEAIQVGNSFKK